MSSYRLDKINKQFQREIALLLELRIKKEKVKSAVITGVRCSRDLSVADVYFTTVEKGNRSDVKKELQAVSGTLRSMLGKVLHLKQIPELHFTEDKSEEYGRYMDSLLDRIKQEENREDS